MGHKNYLGNSPKQITFNLRISHSLTEESPTTTFHIPNQPNDSQTENIQGNIIVKQFTSQNIRIVSCFRFSSLMRFTFLSLERRDGERSKKDTQTHCSNNEANKRFGLFRIILDNIGFDIRLFAE